MKVIEPVSEGTSVDQKARRGGIGINVGSEKLGLAQME